MTDSQQNCFLAVAEYRSFSRAASALYVSQPAVSKNISTLEAEIGSALFDRQGKYVVLTKAGEIFLNFLVEYRREYESMTDRIKALDWGVPNGTVRIGCGQTWNAAHFYNRLSRHFAIHFPGVQLEVEGLDPEAFLPALRRKEVDVMIMYTLDLERQPDIVAEPLVNIGSGFLCSSLLAKPNGGRLEDLAEHKFLVAENSTDHRNSNNYRQLVSSICEKSGFSPSFKSCRNLSSGLVDLSCGKGVLLVDDWTSAINNSEYCYIPTGETFSLSLAHLPNSSNSVLSLFVNEALKVFNGNY